MSVQFCIEVMLQSPVSAFQVAVTIATMPGYIQYLEDGSSLKLKVETQWNINQMSSEPQADGWMCEHVYSGDCQFLSESLWGDP